MDLSTSGFLGSMLLSSYYVNSVELMMPLLGGASHGLVPTQYHPLYTPLAEQSASLSLTRLPARSWWCILSPTS